MSKLSLRWIILLAAVAVSAFFGIRHWQAMQAAVPKGIASGNGRIEAKLVDVAAKEALRVKEMLVDEGQLVTEGEVLVRLDTATLESQLAEAKANVAANEERAAISKSAIVKCKSEVELAEIELDRARRLFDQKAGSKQDVDRRDSALKVTNAALGEAEASLRTATQQVEVAQNNVATIQTRIDDATLISPVRGRVLYRLAEEGEVLAPGGKALTLVNLEDIYMEIFLPSEQAANLKVGDEARITLDHAPGKAAKGHVSFVSPKAQFTPKQVETHSERDKLMFRVKIQVPEELVKGYLDRVKTGVRGMAYVKIEESAGWPDWLQNLVTPPSETETKSTDKPAAAESGTESQ
jgi:HlyD family secretion protein